MLKHDERPVCGSSVSILSFLVLVEELVLKKSPDIIADDSEPPCSC